jgi:anaerobic selenocysteine-containing dehydrogenase
MPDTNQPARKGGDLPRRMTGHGEVIETSAPIGDAVKTTTCYMCACRCGIKVHLKDGRVRYIEGNPDHPVNRGVLCGKGSAGS